MLSIHAQFLGLDHFELCYVFRSFSNARCYEQSLVIYIKSRATITQYKQGEVLLNYVDMLLVAHYDKFP